MHMDFFIRVSIEKCMMSLIYKLVENIQQNPNMCRKVNVIYHIHVHCTYSMTNYLVDEL